MEQKHLYDKNIYKHRELGFTGKKDIYRAKIYMNIKN